MVPRLQVVRGTRWARGGDRRDGSGMIRRKLLRNMLGKQSEASGPLRRVACRAIRAGEPAGCRSSAAPGGPRGAPGGTDPA
jgi:hypothetical protein